MFSRAAGDVARDDDIEIAVCRFGPELYGLALAITANRAEADDAYQSAWVEAIRHWDQLRIQSKRRAWLASVVARSARRAQRQRALWLRRHTELNDGSGLAAIMEWDPTLGTALAHLSPRQRAVVDLHYGQGYSLDEAAEFHRDRA
jgi:RNA polymerase sigma factor (sigma-70 family)